MTLRNQSCPLLLLNNSWFGFFFVLWKVPVFGPVHFNLIFLKRKEGDFPFYFVSYTLNRKLQQMLHYFS